MKIRITSNIIDQLYGYFDSDYEVGGALFGSRNKQTIEVMAVSMKYGTDTTITFDKNDLRLFYPPNDMELLGTWHTHPFQNTPIPSVIDYAQWSIWDKKFIHLILARRTGIFFGYKKFKKPYFRPLKINLDSACVHSIQAEISIRNLL